jgi:hypothetical protein
MKRKIILAFVIPLLAACARPSQPVPPNVLPSSPAETPAKILTAVPTEPFVGADPTLFGALAKSEINPLAGKIHEAIFIKAMDSFVAGEDIIEYQIVASEVFPASDGTLIVEIYYNVRTTDPAWLTDGGVQSDDNWITNKCNRFDFVNTETEFQLKNRRTCN